MGETNMKYTPLPSPPSPPHLTVEVVDKVLGKLDYVVLDRPVQGSAFGPIRFASYLTLDDLIFNARAMTHKWAFVHVPLGGAFAGICADLHQLGCSRAALMETFGRLIAPLIQQRVYYFAIKLRGLRCQDEG
jgi:glutamate dehydrogenase/leucine dehydrogenase